MTDWLSQRPQAWRDQIRGQPEARSAISSSAACYWRRSNSLAEMAREDRVQAVSFAERFRTTRMVLKTSPAREALQQMADEHGWSLAAETVSESQVRPRREIRWALKPVATVRYVEDDMSPHCWVVVGSPVADRTQTVAQLIVETLDPWSAQECADLVDAADELPGLANALLRLGIAAPHDFDYHIFQYMMAGLTHPDERVRDTSLWAITYSPWREYLPLLEEVAHTDPAEKLRQRAQMVLEAFDAAGVS